MAPAYFMSAVRAWLVGGAFPALGLTALREEQDGALHSEGLALFTGYEVTSNQNRVRRRRNWRNWHRGQSTIWFRLGRKR